MSNEGKKCTVHYTGTFNDGTKFDSSYDRGEPIDFVCGAGMMIKGFDEAVKGMTIGDVLRSAFQFLFAMEAEIGGFINLVQNIIVKVIWMHFYVGMCYMFLTTMYPKAYSFVFENTYVDSVLKYFGKYIEQLFTYIISK